ncbi:hypothetical protein Tco_1385215 [Tanacetum coccineum]
MKDSSEESLEIYLFWHELPNSKVGLGFEIKSNNEVLSFEEEMNFSVFKCSKEDSIGKPSYSRFTKTNNFKGVPHPLNGDYTPKPQEEIDDSLYVYGKKGPQKPEISVSDDNSSEHSTCQSNGSEGSCGNTSEHSFETESESLSEPNEMSKSRLEVTNEKDVSAPKSKEVEPSCVSHIKTPRQPLKTKKKTHLSHLIKDCDYYEKKMAREAEVKRVVNTGNGVAKPVWTNANRINHANKLVPRSVQLNTGRTNINSVRPKLIKLGLKVESSRPKEHPLKNMVDRGIFDSGCSRHMTGNKDQLEDFEEFNGGSVTFGGSKGYISGKGRIREHPLKNMVDRVVPQLISRIDSLETDLKQTKLTMGNALVKLVKKVKKLEGFLKRRNVVLSDSEEEEPEAQGRKSQDDPARFFITRTGYNLLQNKTKEKGEAPMIIEETPKKSKEQILQEEASLAEAIRLDSLQKEEEAKQIHLDSLLAQRIAEEEELNEQQKKRKAQVQFEA